MNALLTKLQLLSAVIAQRSEVIVIFVVIGIIFMMILPLPTGLVDGLIALNISVSALMVVMAMYMPGPLAFSTFPALLLVTTLFRMGLSITTTRLILLQGDAGSIVEAFGSFVVGGNLVVGLVIFLILTIVNFLVITKGSERVAEVSARFTLDAMPGKQMSIDSDLRAGLIDAGTAQKKRGDVGRESQLFGAMDGAMKFVKGDAIAGIIIVMVNILGGFSIGVSQLGLPAGEAIKVYSTLTIGDGLVAQIPALLISLTAGMIITRVSDSTGEVTNIGQDMATELSSEPKAWIIAAFVMLGFSLIPGMPALAFILFATFFGCCGAFQIYIKNKNALQLAMQHNALQEQQQKLLAAQSDSENCDHDVKTFLPYDKLSFVTHPDEEQSVGRLETLRAIRRARNQIVTEKGYTIPSFDLNADPKLSPNTFQITVYGVPRYTGSFVGKKVAVHENLIKDELKSALGKNLLKGDHKCSEQNIDWVPEEQIELLRKYKIPFTHQTDLVTQRTQEVLRKECAQFIGVEETTKIMGWMSAEFPALAGELQRLLPLSKFTEVLQHLAAENISIRSVRKVVEVIAEKAAQANGDANLIDLVRVGLKDQICNELSIQNSLNVLLMEKDLENFLRSSTRDKDNEKAIVIPPEENKKLINVLRTEIRKQHGRRPILVVAQDLRHSLRELLKQELFGLTVLSYPEVTDSVKVVPLARISI